ncbi:MAG TPA: efflux transporter outer membrane subunit [Paracoccaceae bacterium]
MAGRIGRAAALIGYTTAVSIALAGCARETPYTAPFFSFSRSYATQTSGVPVLLDNAAWWTGFREPVLDALVEQALRGNLDLAVARERIEEAQANLRTIPNAALLTPEARISRNKAVEATPETRSEASLGLSWMLDPYGARRQQIKAARARIEAADAEADAARLLVLFNLANAYVDLRFRQRLLQIRQQEVRARQQTLDLTRRLFEQQSATRLDIVHTEARLAEAEAQIPTLRAAIQSQKYQIATLLGATPGTLGINLDGGGQPAARLSTEVGIPADLLRNRPDIRIAERLYYATVAEIDVAQADLYPRLSLSGAITLASIGGTRGTEYFFGPSIVLPALPNGDRKAAVAVRESRARQANVAWKSTVLDAILEVETALLDYSGSSAAVRASRKTVGLYREAVDLTLDLVTRDSATIRDLLEAEESTIDAELALAENLRQQARGFISLNVGLGSGNAHGKTATVLPPAP